MDPKEIFELIVKADERLKYAHEENQEQRTRQARELLVKASEEARAIGNEALVAQAEQRLSDLGMPPVEGAAEPAPARSADTEERRPTPLDPYPEPRPPQHVGDEKALPRELGPESVAVLEGRTFIYSNSLGDVPPDSAGGLLHDDTRFVSRWELTLNGRPLSLLKSRVVDYYSAAFFLTNPEVDGLAANTLSIRRLRFVGGGLHEQIAVYNPTYEPLRFTLSLETGADFADLFEVKSEVRDRSKWIDTEHDEDEGLIHFHYEKGDYLAETNIHSANCRTIAGFGATGEGTPTPAKIEGDAFVWDLELPGRHTMVTAMRVTVRVNETTLEPMHDEFGQQQLHADGALTSWLDEVPRFSCDESDLKDVFDQSIVDLAALRIAGELGGESYVLPAAGLPWFMTLFGRDTLVTSLQSIWVGPELARGALHLLGSLQGTEVDDFKDEEPGKILHEVRDGELTVTGEKPHSPYYGTCDATPLYLILMSEYWRYTGDDAFVKARWSNVEAALEWIDRFGDSDGDGFVEYITKSSQGLGNQCWKDSWDGVQFSDGRIPYLPIATAEIQGYVYDAKLRMAELAEGLIEDQALADRLRNDAGELFERFNDVFWSDDRGGYYAIGLDADKAPIDSITSNMGHLLWSGIVPPERAKKVRDQLMGPDMFTGWGIRTLSAVEHGFNPIGYHIGTIWPHDNSIAAWGLARAGFRDDANKVALGQLEAATFTDYRLPEAFAGFDKDVAKFPVPYPTACSPQAWATGAPFAFIQVMLGLDARDGEVTIDPHVPEELGRLFVHGMHAFETHWDVDAKGDQGDVRPTR